MQCKRCGAELLDTDTFCVNCGQKVGDESRCPVCGELLREGTRFCHKCGTSVEDMVKANIAKRAASGETEEMPLIQQKTMDIPFDLIEKSILLEAEQAIEKRSVDEKKEILLEQLTEQAADLKKDRPVTNAASEDLPIENLMEGIKSSAGYNQKRASSVREEHDEDEDDEFEYEFEDDDDSSWMSKVSKIIGIVIILVILAAAFFIWRNYAESNTDSSDEETAETTETLETEAELPKFAGRIQVLESGVNIRDDAGTDSVILGAASPGEVFDYYELVEDAWYHVALEDGSDAYISAYYVEELD